MFAGHAAKLLCALQETIIAGDFPDRYGGGYDLDASSVSSGSQASDSEGAARPHPPPPPPPKPNPAHVEARCMQEAHVTTIGIPMRRQKC